MEIKQWSLPLKRLPLYGALFLLLPLGMVVYSHLSTMKQWEDVHTSIKKIQLQANTKAAKQAVNRLVRKQFTPCNPAYIEQNIESIVCLEKEKRALEKLFESPSFRGNEVTVKRYQELCSPSNQLQFAENSTQTFDGVCETLHPLAHPVEIDNENLKQLLSQIEHKQEKQPLLLIKDFSLKRKTTPLESEVYQLSMTLIKREFSS